MLNTNQTDPFGHFSRPSPTVPRRAASFLEAFKENSLNRPLSEDNQSVFLEAFKKSAAKTMVESELRPGSDFNVSEAFRLEEDRKREKELRFREALMAKQRQEEDRSRFLAKQKEVEKQIEALREAILKIAKSTQNLSREVEKSAFETPVMPGTYHLNFFERLKGALELIKKRIDESASWIHVFNQRQKRMPYFWTQVAKSGTKYMLSSERYMQMSAG